MILAETCEIFRSLLRFYKIRITAGLTSIREMAALSSLIRIAYKLNKDLFD